MKQQTSLSSFFGAGAGAGAASAKSNKQKAKKSQSQPLAQSRPSSTLSSPSSSSSNKKEKDSKKNQQDSENKNKKDKMSTSKKASNKKVAKQKEKEEVKQKEKEEEVKVSKNLKNEEEAKQTQTQTQTKRLKEEEEEVDLMDTTDDEQENEKEETKISKSKRTRRIVSKVGGGRRRGGGGGRNAKKAKLVIEDDDDSVAAENNDNNKNDEDEHEKGDDDTEMKEVHDDDEDEDEDEDEDFEAEEEDEEEEEFVDEVDEDEVEEDDLDEDDMDEDEAVNLEELKTKPKPKPKKESTKKNAFTTLLSQKQSPTSKSTKQTSKSKPKSTTPKSKLPNTKNDDSEWSNSKPCPYSTFTQTLSSIEAITSRLEIQSILTNLFSQCIRKQPNDLLTLVYLSSNSVAPAYECVELGIGDAILIKAIAEANGSTSNMIKQKYESDGDLGTVAMNAKGKQRTLGFGRKPKPLMAEEVLKVYRQIAAISGSQSQKLKVDLIKGLLVRAGTKVCESKYIIRGLQGKLRIGLAESTVLISLAHAVYLSCPSNSSSEEKKEEKEEEEDNNDTEDKKDNKHPLSSDIQTVKNLKLPIETRLESAVNIVKKAYSEVSSFDALVDALITTPIWELQKSCTLRPGNPVTPMLAKPTKSILEVLKRLKGKRFTCEYKYDGERAQVHMKDDGVTKVFSRSLLDTSEKFPEVPLYVKEACINNVQSFILDTEVVAYNRETKQFVPFQVLSTRKRTEESDDNAKVKVIVQAFDLMYLNGQSLLDHTLSERRELLLKHFQVVDGKFQFATSLDHKEDGDMTLIEDFLDAAVKGQCEGLMVKTLDENASYQPSYRSLNWLKLKKDYLEGMGDSVDLVPIGAYHGRGKRTGVYGAYLLACYDVDTEEFQSVCKIGTGFSDEDLKTLSDGLKGNIIKEKSSQYNVSSTLECDVWFEASQVWEVKAADLSKSSTHKGAIDKTGDHGRGIGLRFPRFERLRDDKKPENATTSDQILEMYYAQDSIVDNGVTGLGDDGI